MLGFDGEGFLRFGGSGLESEPVLPDSPIGPLEVHFDGTLERFGGTEDELQPDHLPRGTARNIANLEFCAVLQQLLKLLLGILQTQGVLLFTAVISLAYVQVHIFDELFSAYSGIVEQLIILPYEYVAL